MQMGSALSEGAGIAVSVALLCKHKFHPEDGCPGFPLPQ